MPAIETGDSQQEEGKEPKIGHEGFNMYDTVHEYEARLIEQALDEAGGSVTKAARLLGLTHQTLGTILNTRHKRLADKRTPVRRRLRSRPVSLAVRRSRAADSCRA